jgi:hypothetical protein
VGGAYLQSRAAGKAADTQADAMNYATAEQARQFDTSQQNMAPWLQVGQQGLGALSYGLGLGGLDQSQYYQLEGDPIVEIPAGMDFYGQRTARLSQIEQWLASQEATVGGRAEGYSQLKTIAEQARNQAVADEMAAKGITSGSGASGQYPIESGEFMQKFSDTDWTQDPGYAFRVSEGEKALERSAAARGGALGGGAVRSALRYNQDMASQEYNNAFNRYQTEQSNRYNRLAGIAGTGQQAATTLAGLGQNYASAVGENAAQAANARASGYMGSANAWSNAIANTSNNIMNSILLSQIMGG